MELALIAAVALATAAVTLFSGFGLGTVLMPVFALFFPLPLAIAATAIVHFANNLFKLGLMARRAEWRVVARFGVPAALSAIVGAALLDFVDRMPAIARYAIGQSHFEVTSVKLLVGLLIIGFGALELSRRFQSVSFAPRWLPLGGVLSGFFGGLSGMQGALRAVFLLKVTSSKEAFVATGVVVAVLVDAGRLAVYGTDVMGRYFSELQHAVAPVVVATACAFVGSFAGARLLKKVTYRAVQIVVAAGMLFIGAALISGLV
jgi:uncharacterized protein